MCDSCHFLSLAVSRIHKIIERHVTSDPAPVKTGSGADEGYKIAGVDASSRIGGNGMCKNCTIIVHVALVLLILSYPTI